jgi:hypothetical protein
MWLGGNTAGRQHSGWLDGGVLVSSVNLEVMHRNGTCCTRRRRRYGSNEWTQDWGRCRGRVAGHASRVGEHLGRRGPRARGVKCKFLSTSLLWLPCVVVCVLCNVCSNFWPKLGGSGPKCLPCFKVFFFLSRDGILASMMVCDAVTGAQ